jgi:NAD(P)H-dependent FMN reductase
MHAVHFADYCTATDVSAPLRIPDDTDRACSSKEAIMSEYKVGYLVGSLATASINRKLVNALVHLAPPQLHMIEIAIAQQQLKSVLNFCNAPQMNAPEAYIQFKPGLITDDGQVTDELTEEFLRTYMEDFRAFIERVYTVLPRAR